MKQYTTPEQYEELSDTEKRMLHWLLAQHDEDEDMPELSIGQKIYKALYPLTEGI